MPVIHSTASNDNSFPVYENLVTKSQTRGNTSPATIRTHVVIKGKANVKNDKTFITPRGVATVVSKEALEHLKKDPAFLHMVKNGFMVIDEKADVVPDQKAQDKFAKANMTAKDKSAQLTDKYFESMKLEGLKVPKVDDSEESDDE
jgi:hypothetical protein